MKRLTAIILAAILAGAVFSSCKEDRYVASVTGLQLVSVSPPAGYSGGIIKILGRNFSETFGGNRVFVGELEAQVLEYNAWDLTIVLPAQDPGIYSITVETPEGTASGLKFEYKEKPEHEYILSTIAGGAAGFEDGNGAAAKIHQPEGLAMDRNGNLWITQRGSQGWAIRKMDRNFNVTTVAATELPWHCSFDRDGNFYFTAKDKKAVYKVTPDGTLSPEAVTGADLDNPMDVEFDNDGAMWIASRNNNRVYKVVEGTAVRTYDIKFPTCLAVDMKGRMIVGSTTAGYMYMIDGDDVVPIAGNGTNAKAENPDGNSGDTSTASVGQTNGVFCASDGSIWFADTINQAVRRLTPDASGDFTKGKIETVARGFYPSDVYVTDDCSKAYVSSATTHTIRLIEIF